MTLHYMAVDQHGQTYHGLTHPRKDLVARPFVGSPLPGHYTPYTANVPLGKYEPCKWAITMHQTLREARAALAAAGG